MTSTTRIDPTQLKNNLAYQAARRYIARGWAVFPVWSVNDGVCACPKGAACVKDTGKHPMIAGGFQKASKHGLDVDLWWSKFPDANVGIATGLVSGIAVVDVDYKNGGIYSDPNTVRTKTGGGGMHVFYRTNGTPARSRVGFRQGLDIRADGGYIVAPPSVHKTGASYEWVDETGPLAPMPDWMVEECAPLDPVDAHPQPTVKDPDAFKRARAYFEKVPPCVCDTGTCDADGFKKAVTLVRGFNLNDEQAYEILSAWAQRSKHNWEEWRLRRKIIEARRVGHMTPGAKLLSGPAGQKSMGIIKVPTEIKSTPLPPIMPEPPEPAETKTPSPAELKPAAADPKKLKCPGLHPDAEIPIDWIVCPYATPDVSMVFMEWKKRKDSNGDTYMVQVPVAVSHTPMVVLARSIDVSTNQVRLEIGIEHSSGWETRHVPALTLRSSTEMVKCLGGIGADVHTNNARHLVNFFSGYERANAYRIPHRKTSGQCGHHGKGFLLGATTIGQTDVEYLGDDAGDDNRAKRVKSVGKFPAWLATTEHLNAFPLARLAMLAALAAPLLKVLHAPNFVIDFSNTTSAGKSTSAQVAASVWGNPDARAFDSYAMSWDSTQVAIERTAAILCDLPLILDETKRAAFIRGVSVVPGIVYAYSNGEGRGRGSIMGMRDTKHWRGIMISTGEQRIADMSKDGGIAARVLSIWAMPFGETSRDTASTIHKIKDGITRNYGHAGPHFVEYILANRDNWDAWRTRHQDISNSYLPKLVGVDAGIAERLVGYLATLEMAGQLFADSLGVLSTYDSPIPATINVIAPDAQQDANKPKTALVYVYEWCTQNQSRFYGTAPETYTGNLVGNWSSDWDAICILPSVLDEVFTKGGFDAAAMRRHFVKEKYIRKFADGKSTRNMRVGNGSPRCVFIERDAIESI